jgi:hypothetical protein
VRPNGSWGGVTVAAGAIVIKGSGAQQDVRRRMR